MGPDCLRTARSTYQQVRLNPLHGNTVTTGRKLVWTTEDRIRENASQQGEHGASGDNGRYCGLPRDSRVNGDPILDVHLYSHMIAWESS